MGSVGLEASLPRPPWKETTLLHMSRAASSAPVPQNNIHHNIEDLLRTN
jgi:hypothetical protein